MAVVAVMDVMFVGTARPEELLEVNIDGRRGVRDVNVLENRD